MLCCNIMGVVRTIVEQSVTNEIREELQRHDDALGNRGNDN